jgi:hypothetical protein
MERDELPMMLFTEGPGAISSLIADGGLRVEEIDVAQFIRSLCQVVDGCRYFAQDKLIARR